MNDAVLTNAPITLGLLSSMGLTALMRLSISLNSAEFISSLESVASPGANDANSDAGTGLLFVF